MSQKASYPTAPIAWMSQAYETTPTPEPKVARSQPVLNTSTVASLER